ncbi:hypothetical protein [Streptomyces sp. NPDC020917]|uniref:hypothetical protein n=1 Tax=Streptomyces sp. NPDC020917 TaxID=3365102 RepID=UPI003798EDA4
MSKGLGVAGRRAVRGADPETGRVKAPPAVCAALVAAGLAVPHGRGGHHSHYLTTEGRRLRAELAEAGATQEQAPGAEPPAPAGGSFTADDGSGATAPTDPARRAAEVATAWEGLLQIRSVLMDGVTTRPAPWERERVVHAVALALEAAGCPPARPGSPGASGYRVAASPHPGTAEISWSPTPSADALDRCAQLLTARGWQSTRHRSRAGDPYLLTTPANR